MRPLLLGFAAFTFFVRSALRTPLDLASASRVEAFRLAPLFDKHYRTSKRFHDAKLVSGPRLVGATEATLIAQELERIYPIEFPSSCLFAPRYGLRFHLASWTVDVLICPHCGEVQFHAPGFFGRLT